jgi:hypothetical protein
MFRPISLIFAILAYGALGGGYLLKERAKNPTEGLERPVVLEAAKSHSGKLARPLSGRKEIYLGIRVAEIENFDFLDRWIRQFDVRENPRGDAPVIRADLWLGRKPDDAAVHVQFGYRPFGLPANASTDRELVLDAASADFGDAPITHYKFEIQGGDSFFFAHAPYLQIGKSLPKTYLTKKIGQKLNEPLQRAGLLMLSGIALVFIHLFFVAARLLVPWRKDPPPPDLDMPA